MFAKLLKFHVLRFIYVGVIALSFVNVEFSLLSAANGLEMSSRCCAMSRSKKTNAIVLLQATAFTVWPLCTLFDVA